MTNLQVMPPGGGEALWFLDTLMHVKLPGAATRGELAVFEQLAPPGSATPMHRHDETDEHFFVLSGSLVFHGAGEPRQCSEGAFVTVPRGTTHGFRVTDDGPARLLVFTAPATFEGFVRAVGRPAPVSELPPAGPPPDPTAVQQLAGIGALHDVVIVGPPPAAV
jgi:quercetin dioxygenase-like cupin family protein